MNTNKVFSILKLMAETGDFFANASLAAAIVYKNEIVGIGINEKKTHPFQKRFAKNQHSVYLHAETSAIKQALKKISVDELKYAKMFVLRIKKDGTVAMSKPCPGCHRCIETFGIKKVYYTTDAGEWNKL
jgi:deoxycytidylate deaminase